VTATRPGLVEPLVAFAAATAIASALFWTSRGVPFLAANLHGFIALVFLYVPWGAARLSGQPFDYREGGLRLDPVGRGLVTCGLTLIVTWPIFIAGFFAFYGNACRPEAPALAQWWWESFAPLCPRWAGRDAPLTWPRDFGLLALSQVLVVALPEELFFRGYLYQRFLARWPARRRVLGAPVGRALLVTSALFALGHVLVDFQPGRLAVFFPGLVFGWMRARSGSIAAGTLYHALCNLLSDVLHETYFR
jgi:hypothetical protein